MDKDNLKDEKSDDFVENNEGQMSTFCEFHNLTSLSKEPEYFKNPNYPWRNDLRSTSLPHSSQGFSLIEAGLSDFHKITVTVIKVIFYRLKLSAIETEKCQTCYQSSPMVSYRYK